ncbi:Something about silencing protein 10 [Cladophialophora carrionii]|uniref:Something about silencing protein 10 n=1 Tax=Cladophialophora carrionii TaxID=86049 RepID=A0A1C1C720_9EURO|nr:Something about silencing protein 10 [Cladophialophora carrionii]
MAKKRKAPRAITAITRPRDIDRFDPEETFNDSEDDFFAGRDKVMLDEEPAAKRRRRLEEQERTLQPSDEEVYLDRDQESEDDDEGHDAVEEEEEEEDDTYWGTSKADYYNADVIETEADALEEEQEARRLQEKQLKAMTEADFGFDESAWADDSQTDKGPTVERLPELQVPDSATDDERLKILKSRYPEFEPLAKDVLELQSTYQLLKKEAESERPGDGPGPIVKFRALSAYLGSVAVYLSLLTSTKNGLALPPGELRQHPVMANLVRCRQLWQEVESLRSTDVQTEERRTKDKVPELMEKAQPTPEKKTKKAKKGKKRSLTPPDQASPEPQTGSTKRRREKKGKQNDLQKLLDASLKKPTEAESDFGDEAPLTHEEAEEKARRKKSLRFYTSQIVQKANKRGAASRQAGGDDDVPYKERIRDKQERLMREAEQRARSNANKDEALGTDDEGSDRGHEIDDEANEYYDMLVSNSKQKKAGKQARAEAYAEAARHGAQVYEQEQVGPDGKRKITYAIEKNKGLQPKRKKDVRNPRVKKRKKFDEKMKKLSSMRPVYKGGEGRGGYGGEATGIKTNVVKSVKL